MNSSDGDGNFIQTEVNFKSNMSNIISVFNAENIGSHPNCMQQAA